VIRTFPADEIFNQRVEFNQPASSGESK